MRKLIISLIAAFFLSATAGQSYSHDPSNSLYPVQSKEVSKRAVDRLEELAELGIVEGSWSETPVKSVEREVFGSRIEWRVLFYNEKTSKRTLCMVFTGKGRYLAMIYKDE